MARGERDSAIATAYQLWRAIRKTCTPTSSPGPWKNSSEEGRKLKSCIGRLYRLSRITLQQPITLHFLWLNAARIWIQLFLWPKSLGRKCLIPPVLPILWHGCTTTRASMDSPQTCCEKPCRKLLKNAIYHYHLDMAYDKYKNRAGAIKHLSRALQINPTHPDARLIRETLKRIGSGAADPRG
jgi:hypothetical protein